MADQEQSSRRRVVLIADGDESIRSLVNLTLNSDTTEVIEAPDTDTALERLAADRPQVALVDADLPSEGGKAVCARIKELGGVRTVLLVSKSQADEFGDDPNVDALLGKPFTSLSLLHKVNEVVGA